MTRVTIFKKNTDENFCPVLVLAMTYIKNYWATRAV